MNFEQNLVKAEAMPQYYLGQQVTTKEGRGIIVKLEMPSNGLQITVWYGCGNDSIRWVQLTYSIIELQVAMINAILKTEERPKDYWLSSQQTYLYAKSRVCRWKFEMLK